MKSLLPAPFGCLPASPCREAIDFFKKGIALSLLVFLGFTAYAYADSAHAEALHSNRN